MLAILLGCESFSWGDDTHGQLGDGIIGGGRVAPGAAAAGDKWTVLRAGPKHTCGIKPGGSLWCWGLNNTGQLGNGTEDVDSAVPVQVGSATDWSQVAPGIFHTCGIRAGGQLWCWGGGLLGRTRRQSVNKFPRLRTLPACRRASGSSRARRWQSRD